MKLSCNVATLIERYFAEWLMRQHNVSALSDPLLHRFMAASVSASIELALRSARIRYIHRYEIFCHAMPRRDQARSPNPPLALKGKRLNRSLGAGICVVQH